MVTTEENNRGKNLKIGILLDFYGDLLTQKQRDAIEYYYDEDLSLSEIAEHTHITRQGVRDAIKRGETLLVEMEEKLKLAQRFGEMLEQVGQIRSYALDIKQQNLDGGFHPEINRLCDRIVEASKNILK